MALDPERVEVDQPLVGERRRLVHAAIAEQPSAEIGDVSVVPGAGKGHPAADQRVRPAFRVKQRLP